MNLWEALNIIVLECVAHLIEKALIDRRTGKCLPIAKRAIPLNKQERALILLKTLSRLKVLRHKPTLKDKLCFLADVLEGRVIHVPMKFISKIPHNQNN